MIHSSETVENRQLNWDHVYLLGYYTPSGEPMLTTWSGDAEGIEVVVTGSDNSGPPIWSAPIPPGCELHTIPEGKDGQEYAKEIGGLFAFGWLLPEKIVRKEYSTQ